MELPFDPPAPVLTLPRHPAALASRGPAPGALASRGPGTRCLGAPPPWHPGAGASQHLGIPASRTLASSAPGVSAPRIHQRPALSPSPAPPSSLAPYKSQAAHLNHGRRVTLVTAAPPLPRSILGQRFQSYSLKTLPEPASAQGPCGVPTPRPSQPSHLPLSPQESRSRVPPAGVLRARGWGQAGGPLCAGAAKLCHSGLTRPECHPHPFAPTLPRSTSPTHRTRPAGQVSFH